MRKAKSNPRKPHCFFTYSTGEPHAKLFLDCLKYVFSPTIEVQATPGALTSGTSQLAVITSLIKDAMFGVVLLDGLRPNVVFEYGVMHGAGRAVLLFKEEGATVDLAHLDGTKGPTEVRPILLDPNSQFSDVKDEYYASWQRFQFLRTAKEIWQQYRQNKSKIAGYSNYIEIPEPPLKWEP